MVRDCFGRLSERAENQQAILSNETSHGVGSPLTARALLWTAGSLPVLVPRYRYPGLPLHERRQMGHPRFDRHE